MWYHNNGGLKRVIIAFSTSQTVVEPVETQFVRTPQFVIFVYIFGIKYQIV